MKIPAYTLWNIKILFYIGWLFFVFTVSGQTPLLPGDQPILPRFAIKSNLLYDATGTLNLGGEIRLQKNYSLDVSFNLNPWTFSGDKKIKHILVQPELRYWVYEPFNGHFFGTHLVWSRYNLAEIHLPLKVFPGLKDHRYEGDLYGVGFSYGYHWLLNNHWSLEASFGFGYLYLDHKIFECGKCGEYIRKSHKHYFGPTKLGLSLIYIIK